MNVQAEAFVRGPRDARLIQPGDRFGRLTVLRDAPSDQHGYRRIVVRCECGTEKVVRSGNVASGRTSSCGCWRVEWMSSLGSSAIGAEAKRRKRKC